MSLSKLCLLTTLVVVVALAALRKCDVATREVDVQTLNVRPYHPTGAPDEPSWRSAYRLVRSNLVFQAEGEARSSVLLPAQSQNPDNLGAGKLLVASRTLGDPNFAETVVLLVRCDVDGVVGLILNRRTDVPLSRVLEQFAGAKDRSDPAYLGGPVEPSAVFALLRSTAKLDGAEQVISGLYLISTKTVFEKVISGRPDPGALHVYLGYAGWSNEQLRKEVEMGSWFIFQGDAPTVFDADPDSLWRQMIKRTELKLVKNTPANAQASALRL
jgi:putative AlgH/UPF0301 family transcriptional regulator